MRRPQSGIEGATYDVGQQQLERVRGRQFEEEEAEAAEGEEEESEGVSGLLNNLNIDTAITEEEAAEQLMVSLVMEVEEDRRGEGEEEGRGTQMALGALEFLTQEDAPSGTTLVDARNGFNKLSRLEVMWTVRHR